MLFLKYPTYADELTTIKDDMSGANEALLMNVDLNDPRPWLTTGGIRAMGYVPRGDNAPQSWQNNVTDTSFKNLIPWEGITPWFVASYGSANTATNTRINISGITLQLYDTSIAAWRKVSVTSSGNPTWCMGQNYANSTVVNYGDSTKRVESNGSWSIQIPSGQIVHGGSTIYALSTTIPTYTNIGGIFVKMAAEMVLDDVNGVDDRSSAQILISIGADFYPHITSVYTDFAPEYYFPATAITRWTLMDVGTRNYCMTTINPPVVTVADKSPYAVAGNTTLMPESTFDAHLPPYIA